MWLVFCLTCSSDTQDISQPESRDFPVQRARCAAEFLTPSNYAVEHLSSEEKLLFVTQGQKVTTTPVTVKFRATPPVCISRKRKLFPAKEASAAETKALFLPPKLPSILAGFPWPALFFPPFVPLSPYPPPPLLDAVTTSFRLSFPLK